MYMNMHIISLSYSKIIPVAIIVFAHETPTAPIVNGAIRNEATPNTLLVYLVA